MTAIPASIGSLDTQVGRLSIAVTPVGVLAVGWGTPAQLAGWIDRRAAVGRSGAHPQAVTAGASLADALDQVGQYFAGERRAFDLPLDWSLVPGRSAGMVLRALHRTVPFGTQITYGALAERSGSAVPARGVGSIMGANPMPIVVPCHRVVAASGLGGFSGGERSGEPDWLQRPERPGSSPHGLQTKRWLLTFEGTLPPTLGWDPAERLNLDGIGPLSDDFTFDRQR